jgi:hypothetical protein
VDSFRKANGFVGMPELVLFERPKTCRPQVPFHQKLDHSVKQHETDSFPAIVLAEVNCVHLAFCFWQIRVVASAAV